MTLALITSLFAEKIQTYFSSLELLMITSTIYSLFLLMLEIFYPDHKQFWQTSLEFQKIFGLNSDHQYNQGESLQTLTQKDKKNLIKTYRNQQIFKKYLKIQQIFLLTLILSIILYPSIFLFRTLQDKNTAFSCVSQFQTLKFQPNFKQLCPFTYIGYTTVEIIQGPFMYYIQIGSLSALEQEVGKALVELENSSSSYKADLQTIFATSAQEYSIVKDNKKSKKVVVITIPYPCLKPLQKVHRALVVDLERKLRAQVLVTAKRTILSRWLKSHKSQQRPRSRTLTAVYDSILDDLVLPSVIIGKRIRVRLDGSRFYRITLDQNDKALLEEKVDGIQHVYKKLTTREINIEFAPDVTYHTLKKN
ncbi:hypothetical protein PPERSA_10418 [Pseudocohnilembus persalinus]|uniref:40S ribosomal protein S7 n=1 Tax=Pseudocohnilembus persalinus TaxID=266149 RepID=A0A0V0QX18_PSEPJ|nr:hypothetical protein PPERSA_10418 [Pseudocohnilembus persalinus]|eukprot:KRX06560.1 hypothetical protein PPERSA_10418 [Pseudocohnilembus persalinus]